MRLGCYPAVLFGANTHLPPFPTADMSINATDVRQALSDLGLSRYDSTAASALPDSEPLTLKEVTAALRSCGMPGDQILDVREYLEADSSEARASLLATRRQALAKLRGEAEVEPAVLAVRCAHVIHVI